MECLVKKIDDYHNEFNNYCIKHGFDLVSYQSLYFTWAMEQHESDLMRFMFKLGEYTNVHVSGSLRFDGKSYNIIPKNFSLVQAINEMLTPDIQDYSVWKTIRNEYLVITTHSSGRNLFKFKILDD